MMSMISVFQTAVRFTDADMVAKILICGAVMILFLSIKGEEEGLVAVINYLLACLFCIFPKYNWNKSNVQPQVENRVVNSERENKKKKVKIDHRDRGDAKLLEESQEQLKEKKLPSHTHLSIPKAPPPVLDNKKKKTSKKAKHSSKKIIAKENKEPAIIKGKTKTYESMKTCERLSMPQKEIYDELYKLKLNESLLASNNYPDFVDFKPPNVVPADCDARLCSRCGAQFEVYNGCYLSSTKCYFHPRKPVYESPWQVKKYPCCNKWLGDAGCTESNYHITVQHHPKPFRQTPTKRHIKKDLQHRVFGLDCEMCYTTAGMEVTRICLVDLNGLPVYHSYVKPKNKILDYCTLYSGVQKHHLEKVTITLDDVREILCNFIHSDTILVGHALNNDLTTLGIIHKTVVDTSVLYPNEKLPRNKRSLKSLANQFLHISIQDDPSGHDCIEDARASLRLALLKIPPKPTYVSSPLVPEENKSIEQPVIKCKVLLTPILVPIPLQPSSITTQKEQRKFVGLVNYYCLRAVREFEKNARYCEKCSSMHYVTVFCDGKPKIGTFHVKD